MEEAEILSDKIGIIVGGMLRCVDTSKNLKEIYTPGLKIQIYWKKETAIHIRHSVINSMKSYTGEITTGKSFAEICEYKLQNISARNARSMIFKILEQERGKTLLEWSISDKSLEDVFLEVIDKYRSQTPNRARYYETDLDSSLGDLSFDNNQPQQTEMVKLNDSL